MRREAADALARLGDGRPIPSLLRAVRTAAADRRADAIVALGGVVRHRPDATARELLLGYAEGNDTRLGAGGARRARRHGRSRRGAAPRPHRRVALRRRRAPARAGGARRPRRRRRDAHAPHHARRRLRRSARARRGGLGARQAARARPRGRRARLRRRCARRRRRCAPTPRRRSIGSATRRRALRACSTMAIRRCAATPPWRSRTRSRRASPSCGSPSGDDDRHARAAAERAASGAGPAPAADWIALDVVDFDGAPLGDAGYRLVLPDGLQRAGVTDERGVIREECGARRRLHAASSTKPPHHVRLPAMGLAALIVPMIPGVIWLWIIYQHRLVRAGAQAPRARRPSCSASLPSRRRSVPSVSSAWSTHFCATSRPRRRPASWRRLPMAIGCFLVIGPREEIAKFLAVRLFVYRNKEFNEPLDGIIYAAAAALGFASLENMLYVIDWHTRTRAVGRARDSRRCSRCRATSSSPPRGATRSGGRSSIANVRVWPMVALAALLARALRFSVDVPPDAAAHPALHVADGADHRAADQAAARRVAVCAGRRACAACRSRRRARCNRDMTVPTGQASARAISR